MAQVLQTLRMAHLKIRIDKCQFAKNSVKFFCHLITPDGIGPNKKNINCHFIPNPNESKRRLCLPCLMILLLTIYKKLLSSCRPLIQLLKKNAIFHWHTPQHESFMALKERLTTAPFLLYPDFLSCLHRILTLVDIVLALTSLRFNMAKKVQVVYGGQNFSDTKKKYFVTEQEALSVIEAIQKCRPYLMGNSFTVVVDHQLLKWLLSLRDPTWTLARGPLTLQGYDFSIQ